VAAADQDPAVVSCLHLYRRCRIGLGAVIAAEHQHLSFAAAPAHDRSRLMIDDVAGVGSVRAIAGPYPDTPIGATTTVVAALARTD
jgi:hypothetical protein